MAINRNSLGKMYDEAIEQRDKELEHTHSTILVQDELRYHEYIHLGGQEFWTLLHDLEETPDWDKRLLQAMRREARRREINAKRHNESIKTH